MSKVKMMILCALFAALSAVLSQISIPIGPVPITLTHLSIFLAGGLLGAKYGAISQLVYVLLGAIGVPVFSNLSGGIGIIIGARGGYIIGYICCAFLTGLIIEKLGSSPKILMFAMLPGILLTYTLGIIWYMYVTNIEFIPALFVCVLPFIPGDITKIIISAVLINRLKTVLLKKA